MLPSAIEQVEVELLLEALYRRHGSDYRGYARANLDRRVRHLVGAKGLERISELIPRCIHDATLAAELAQQLATAGTDMFRDPSVYRALREQVMPMLRTFPFVKIWHPGCATGEEVYSLAIVLSEADLLHRATIFGTDSNDDALHRARQGILSVERLQAFTRDYQQSGGSRSLSEYYHADHGAASLSAKLKQRITFANHNLTTDAVFGEMHVVCCRNVLIYFNRELKNRALGLFTESLVRGGFLCLGTNEDLTQSDVADHYEVVDGRAKIYRKRES
jgi:chemotaxis protein methyltransferase CheR